MNIRDLNGCRICILGFGREGQATLRALVKHAPQAVVTIADRKVLGEHGDYQVQSGEGYLSGLGRFDWIVKSPGIPPSPELELIRHKLTSATDLFLGTVRSTGATVIGVTGSKGKSTTASLIHAILKADGRATHLVGNIGHPALDYIEEASRSTAFVAEMSSYQLMTVTASPKVGVVTSFFPEHLDYHGSLQAYWLAKANIARFQGPGDALFYNGAFEECRSIAALSLGKRIPFSAANSPVQIKETQLLGEHNRANVAGAYSVASYLGIGDDVSIPAIMQFRGLPHRLEAIGIHDGIEWVDDAISTTPESTIAALDALGDRVETIILGGQDRGYDFAGLARRLATSGVRNVILFPGSGVRIESAIRSLGESSKHLALWSASGMREAVDTARRTTSEGAICLLSTASPSYGMFRNFEEKGEEFARLVAELSDVQRRRVVR